MKFGDTEYTAGEISYVLELLAAMCSTEEIKELFLKFSEGKRITNSTIQQLQMRFADKIAIQHALYINNIEGNPLSHLKIRLDIAYKILRGLFEG